MQYKGVISIKTELRSEIDRWLYSTPKDENDFIVNFLGEDETHTETYVFPDGITMDIKCCGVQYEEDGCNNAWTEAVLFRPNGAEICSTEPEEFYIGEWELRDDNSGNTYIVEVVEKN